MVEVSDGASPLLEFDEDAAAIIEPSMWYSRIDGLPRAAVMTWMPDAFERLLAENPHEERHHVQAETLDTRIYEVQLDAGPIVAALAHVGAPAAALLFEMLVAFGCDTVVAAGSSGGLVPEHPPGTVVVPDAAIRDEGVSHHYAAAGRTASADAGMQQAIRAALTEADIDFVTGDVWTTDALFRETSAKVAARIAEGAIAVDMELSALATVAAFRGVRLGHAVYMADTLHGDAWDPTELIERDTDFRYSLLRTVAGVGAGAV